RERRSPVRDLGGREPHRLPRSGGPALRGYADREVPVRRAGARTRRTRDRRQLPARRARRELKGRGGPVPRIRSSVRIADEFRVAGLDWEEDPYGFAVRGRVWDSWDRPSGKKRLVPVRESGSDFRPRY